LNPERTNWAHCPFKKIGDKSMQASATVNYHKKSTQTQAFHFDVDGIIGNLVAPELIPTKVNVLDLRDGASTVNFNKDGITFENQASQITDFEGSTDWKKTMITS